MGTGRSRIAAVVIGRRSLLAMSVPLVAALVAVVAPASAEEWGGGAADAALVEVRGEVVAVRGEELGVLETGGEHPVAFLIDGGTRVVRDGRRAAVGDLRPGDAVRMSVDGRTGSVVALRSVPAGEGPLSGARGLAWLGTLGLVGGAAVLFARRRAGAWLTVGRVECLRPARRFAWPPPAAVPDGGRG